MKASELRAMSLQDQEKHLTEAHQEMFNLRFQLATRQLQNYQRIHQVRRDIARLMSVMAETRGE